MLDGKINLKHFLRVAFEASRSLHPGVVRWVHFSLRVFSPLLSLSFSLCLVFLTRFWLHGALGHDESRAVRAGPIYNVIRRSCRVVDRLGADEGGRV